MRSRLAVPLSSLVLCFVACGAPDGAESEFSESGGGSTQAGNSGGGFSTGGTLGGGGTPGGGGGAPGNGGPSGSGGAQNPGGGNNTECTNIRPTGTMWDEATCAQWASETNECSSAWMINNNYCNQSCGRCSSGGNDGTGGTGGSGPGTGLEPIDIPSSCTEPGGQVCNNRSGSHCGYTWEYWKDSGNGCLNNRADGFSVNWDNINNLLGRKGLRPGSESHVVTYDADYQPGGNSYLCVYGWFQNPLVEYYIVDSWGDWRPPGDEQLLGTIESDGGVYDIYRTLRENQPSIEGTRTFYQYWSVRRQKVTRGNITVRNHFNGWRQAGMTIGSSIYEVSMTVEGWRSAGTATVRMMID